ncbi:MAG: ATP-binding protein [Calditrichaeota bacterium]|nr:MAG: ATP-binding protein [Calditrichota bacterium]
MKRLIFPRLQQWKDDPARKPVLLRGARQVGKTWIARELGRLFPTFVEVNFELYPEAKEIFQPDLDPRRIIRDVSLLSGKKISPGESLLFLDEIQEAPGALQALRYFYEMMPEQHVIAAGSLLDFELEKIGMPVGRVMSVYMHPMSFLEFLAARNETLLAEMILEHEGTTPISPPIHRKLLHLLGEYMAVGGMPEAVARWCATESLEACSVVHRTIADAYRQDFNKYARKYQIKYVSLLFDTVPALLGEIFKFSRIPGNYRKRELQPALELLEKAGIVHRVIHSAGQGIPLGAQAKLDLFKLLFLDIALAQSVLGLDGASWLLHPESEFVNKGNITEAFVGQELLAYSPFDQKPRLYFWKRTVRGSNAEVDYLLQRHHQIIPIEVKSAAPGRLKSLRLFLQEHPHSPYGIRFSALNYTRDARLHSLPLYAVASILKPPDEGIRYLLEEESSGKVI